MDEKAMMELWQKMIAGCFRIATEEKYEHMVRSNGDIDYIIFESFKYKKGIKLAAHFLHAIATKHPFVDGNKRTAFMMALVVRCMCKEKVDDKFTEILTYLIRKYIKGQDKKIVKFMLETAEYKHNLQEVTKFINENIW
jgi:fido (protein-threonine AMPylation protein)